MKDYVWVLKSAYNDYVMPLSPFNISRLIYE